jgi:hypothetical protein
MIGELAALRKAGVQGCVFTLPEAYAPDVVTRELTLFAENVMPHVR